MCGRQCIALYDEDFGGSVIFSKPKKKKPKRKINITTTENTFSTVQTKKLGTEEVVERPVWGLGAEVVFADVEFRNQKYKEIIQTIVDPSLDQFQGLTFYDGDEVTFKGNITDLQDSNTMFQLTRMDDVNTAENEFEVIFAIPFNRSTLYPPRDSVALALPLSKCPLKPHVACANRQQRPFCMRGAFSKKAASMFARPTCLSRTSIDGLRRAVAQPGFGFLFGSQHVWCCGSQQKRGLNPAHTGLNPIARIVQVLRHREGPGWRTLMTC